MINRIGTQFILLLTFLSAFALTVHAASGDYYITGSSGVFTALIDDPVSGTVVSGASGVSIQAAINAIKTDAAGNDCTIQFGNGVTPLYIGSAGIEFNGGAGGSDWGLITLAGRLNSSNGDGTSSAIYHTNGVSVNSAAYIENTSSSGMGFYSNTTGTLTITGGSVKTTGNMSANAVFNFAAGTVIISGGTIEATASNAVSNNTDGADSHSRDNDKDSFRRRNNGCGRRLRLHLHHARKRGQRPDGYPYVHPHSRLRRQHRQLCI